MPSRDEAPSSCSSQIDANAPTDSCVSTVMTTSGQCGCSGFTCVMSRGLALGGRSRGHRDARRRQAAVGDGRPGGLGRAPQRRATRRCSRSRWRWPLGARADAGRRLPMLQPAVAHVALADDATLGVVCGTPYEQFQCSTGSRCTRPRCGARCRSRILGVGIHRTAAQTRRLEAVVASHRQI